jgi:1-acyl-sn-glycerol-3-phosphate acyltransferase
LSPADPRAAAGGPGRALLLFAIWIGLPLRLAGIVLHIAWGLAAAGLFFPRLSPRSRDRVTRFWSRVLLSLLGVRLTRINHGSAPWPDGASGALLLLNHISWLDVFAVAAVVPARFVAKSEVRSWPVIGSLVRTSGSVFVERGKRHAVSEVLEVVTARLRSGQAVGVFPEGTTTEGDRMLRFHANLVQAALDAPAPVVPLALEYFQGPLRSNAAAFVGDMTLVGSLLRILLAPGLGVRLHLLAAIAPDSDGEGGRRALAAQAQASIAAALSLPDPGPAR